MNIYVALLKGINVGGKNIIKMAELKKVFETIGLYEVKTYIQSGNVLFKSNEDEDALRNKIEDEIEAVFGFYVEVVLRTREELEKIVSTCPFSDKEILEAESSSEAESLYVALLAQVPLKEKIELLDEYSNESNKYRIVGRDIFLLFNDSIRNSKLANKLQKLDVAVTVRNWKTMNKLVALARDMAI